MKRRCLVKVQFKYNLVENKCWEGGGVQRGLGSWVCKDISLYPEFYFIIFYFFGVVGGGRREGERRWD